MQASPKFYSEICWHINPSFQNQDTLHASSNCGNLCKLSLFKLGLEASPELYSNTCPPPARARSCPHSRQTLPFPPKLQGKGTCYGIPSPTYLQHIEWNLMQVVEPYHNGWPGSLPGILFRTMLACKPKFSISGPSLCNLS